MKAKATYSIPELAKLADMHRGQLRRLLDSSGMELGRRGRVIVVYLSALRRELPELWASIKAAQLEERQLSLQQPPSPTATRSTS